MENISCKTCDIGCLVDLREEDRIIQICLYCGRKESSREYEYCGNCKSCQLLTFTQGKRKLTTVCLNCEYQVRYI